LPNQRWQIAPPQIQQAAQLAQAIGLSPLLAQVLINRGMETPQQAQVYLNPESQVMPAPIDEFPDLAISVEMLKEAIASQEKIAICGDYDADGMTSTALLLRALRWLGADVDYAIPSRMKDGYGINKRIVEEFANEGVALILTVDNGISAHDAIARALELGIMVIVTDHHDLPPELPEADAIINPKQLPESSPYRGLAGVGVAYVLAVCLAQELGKLQGLTSQLLELFTLGTIADLAPLTDINRRWLKRGLGLLPKSELAGIQALIQMSGVSEDQKAMKPEDIGFKLGPRINAIGRLSDPQIVIELLTTTNQGVALERAMQCEQINQKRQQLCEQIEQEAIAFIEQNHQDWQQQRVLVIVQPEWHHGVIGIVASRLVERYGIPCSSARMKRTTQITSGVQRGEFPNSMSLKPCNFVKSYW
jgi:single-stranded-DNA-specific exonuclease